jgi:sialidase-1
VATLTRRAWLLGLAARGRDEPRQTVAFRAGENGYHTFRIPALCVTQKGTLLAFCEGRRHSRSDTGDIDLVLKRSFDQGRTWSPMQVVADHGPDTIGNPCPVVDRRNGVIWLPLTGNPGWATQKQILAGEGTRTLWMSRSTDDGATWMPPVEITGAVKDPSWTWCATGPGNAIQLASGRLLVPCDYAPRGTTREHSWVMYSDDLGTTWKRGGELPEGSGESQVAELPDGALLLNARADRGHRRLTARSRDGGLTWTDFAPDEALVEPHCQASLIRHGRRLLFSNPAAETRIRMTVRGSGDGGRTWSSGKLLHEGPSAYSSLAVLRDGSIGCLFERGESNPYETITLAAFSRKWVERS